MNDTLIELNLWQCASLLGASMLISLFAFLLGTRCRYCKARKRAEARQSYPHVFGSHEVYRMSAREHEQAIRELGTSAGIIAKAPEKE